MKRTLLIFAIASTFAVNGFAQAANSGNCFDEYFALFRNRGGKKVTDGDQKIVIAIKKDNMSRCFMGKVSVKNGEIVPPIWVEKGDGSFEEFQSEISPEFKDMPLERRRKIENGMTITIMSVDNEAIKGFFIDFLADKPKANKVAPSAKTF